MAPPPPSWPPWPPFFWRMPCKKATCCLRSWFSAARTAFCELRPRPAVGCRAVAQRLLQGARLPGTDGPSCSTRADARGAFIRHRAEGRHGHGRPSAVGIIRVRPPPLAVSCGTAGARPDEKALPSVTGGRRSGPSGRCSLVDREHPPSSEPISESWFDSTRCQSVRPPAPAAGVLRDGGQR